ncbi:hypothetical protein H5T58_00010 [Candidatus Parcubacteria bacterium]|nr:hypothetical protein [Candidatus Parcubacteria bacterium]
MKKNFKKTIPFLVLCLSLIAFLVPSKTQAIDVADWCGCSYINVACLIRCILDFLLSLPVRIFVAIIILVFYLLAFIGLLIAWIAELLAGILVLFSLQHAFEPAFIGVWNEVRNVALWFVAVFLAFIGIATILRIESYGAKKALVPLLLVAIFINFLPWITRTIINLGNSLTYSFLTRLGHLRARAGGGARVEFGIIGSDILNRLKEQLAQLAGAIETVFTLDGFFLEAFFRTVQTRSGTSRGPFILPIALLIAGAGFGGIFWICYAFLILAIGFYFVVRTAYLWILFIVSPLSFVTLPFSGEKPFKAAFPDILNWEGWFEKILYWSFMGVPIAFFVFIAGYLATQFTTQGLRMSDINFEELATTYGTAGGQMDNFARDVGRNFNDILNSTFRYIPALVALSLGVSISPGLMGQGLRIFWNVGKALTLGGLVSAGLAGGALLRRAAEPITRRIPEEQKRRIEEGLQRIRARTAPYTRMVTKEISKLPHVGEVMEKKEELEKARADVFAKTSSQELKRQLESGMLDLKAKVKIVQILTERGDWDKQTFEKIFAGKTDDEIKRIYGKETFEKIMTRNPHWVAQHIKNSKTGRNFTLEEVIDRIAPSDIQNLSSEALRSPEVLGYILQDRQKARQLANLPLAKRKIVRETLDAGHFKALDQMARSFNERWGTTITGPQLKKEDVLREEYRLSETQLKEIKTMLKNLETNYQHLKRHPKLYT